MNSQLKSTLLSVLLILPSALLGRYLFGNVMSVQYSYYVVCTILILAAFDFATVIFIEQYRRSLGILTIPVLLATIAVILMFTIMESLNRYFNHLGYTFLTPFVLVTILLIYAALFLEKNIMLKAYIAINSVALVLLWITAVTGRVVMPF
jgi:hypothetical protein